MAKQLHGAHVIQYEIKKSTGFITHVWYHMRPMFFSPKLHVCNHRNTLASSRDCSKHPTDWKNAGMLLQLANIPHITIAGNVKVVKLSFL